MAVFNEFRTYVLIDYLFSLSNRRFILSLSTVFVHLPFSNNCRCHGVLALVCIHPTAHPQVLSPDGSFEDVLNRSKVRYNVNIGFLIFPKKSHLRAELSSIVRWGHISPPAMPVGELALFILLLSIVSRMLWICFRQNYLINRKKTKKKIKKNFQTKKKKIFFSLLIFS